MREATQRWKNLDEIQTTLERMWLQPTGWWKSSLGLQPTGAPGESTPGWDSLGAAGSHAIGRKKAHWSQEGEPVLCKSCSVPLAPSTDEARHYTSWQKRNVDRVRLHYYKTGQRRVNWKLRGNKLITGTATPWQVFLSPISYTLKHHSFK